MIKLQKYWGKTKFIGKLHYSWLAILFVKSKSAQSSTNYFYLWTCCISPQELCYTDLSPTLEVPVSTWSEQRYGIRVWHFVQILDTAGQKKQERTKERTTSLFTHCIHILFTKIKMHSFSKWAPKVVATLNYKPTSITYK